MAEAIKKHKQNAHWRTQWILNVNINIYVFSKVRNNKKTHEDINMFHSTALNHLVMVKTKHFAYYKNRNNFFI